MHRSLTGALGFATLGAVAFGLTACATPQGGSPADKRDYVQNMEQQTLDELYERRPDARRNIRNAAGYGVFSNIGTNIILVSTGGGYGVVHNNITGEDTYMKMGELGVGPGLGVTDFRAVLVFHDRDVLQEFVNSGWSWGGQAEAAAKSDDQGGAATAAGNVSESIQIYQFTENGIALSATLSGTRFWPDEELN